MPIIDPGHFNVVAKPGHNVRKQFTVADALESPRLKATIINGEGRIRLDAFHAFKVIHHSDSYLPNPWGDERPPGVGGESDGDDFGSYDEAVVTASASDGEWLSVGDGAEHVTGDIVFEAPTGEAHAAHSAALVVEGWDDRRVEVPIQFVVGGVTVEFPGGPPTVAIGRSVPLPVRVTVTPSGVFDLELKLAADGQHVVIPSESVRLTGGSIGKTLTLHARQLMSPGRYAEELWVTGENRPGPFEGLSGVFPFEVVLEAAPRPTPPPPIPEPHVLPVVTSAATQADWRRCAKCRGLFFDGYVQKGVCPRGGGHKAEGLSPFYVLSHDISSSQHEQEFWRFCSECHGLFYNGHMDKGRCPAGDGHRASGFRFVLPHSLPPAPLLEQGWRFCSRCYGLFLDGQPADCPVGGFHAPAGLDYALPHGIKDPVVLEAPIRSGGLAALGGQMRVILDPRGTVRWQGHAHNSGADGYDFGVSAIISTPSGQALGFAHQGRVGGTLTSGSRDHDWSEEQPLSQLHLARFAEFGLARFGTTVNYESDIGSSLESAAGWIVRYAVGSVVGPVVGAISFVGLSAGSYIVTGSAAPGARLVEGILWMAGPLNTLYAVAASGLASAGSRERRLSPQEYDWANQEVFGGSLPPRERLWLTDTIGGGNRAFTFPRFDERISLNMGPTAFDDPRSYNGENTVSGTYGRTFIHELVHACQIHHAKTDLSLMADAFASKLCEVTGSNPYNYGPAGFEFTDQGLEQQAQVVGDWFVGFPQKAEWNTNHTGHPKDPNSPYFRYIIENVRAGHY
ncbi:hypothetical protein [Bradyrhizobium cenepequi]